MKSVTLGDEEASRRGVQKTILERKGPSTFTCGAEIISKTEIRVHRSLESTVDALLAGFSYLRYFQISNDFILFYLFIQPFVFYFLIDSGRSPNFEVRKINPDGSKQEMLANQIESDNTPQKETKISVDNMLKYSEEKNSDGVLESKPEEAEGSHPTGMDICLYIYGVRLHIN